MSLSNVIFGAGTLMLFLVQRLSALAPAKVPLSIVAVVVAYLGAAVLRGRSYSSTKDEGVRRAHIVAFIALAVTLVAVGVYGLTTDSVVGAMSLSDEAEARWLGVFGWLWPLIWLLGALPLIAVDWGISHSPVMLPKGRGEALAGQAVLVALGVALAFPVNYIGTEENERWDTAYFKTPAPGTATLALAQSLEQPLDIRIFMPPSSEVGLELRHYFDELVGPNVRVHMLDQAAQPRLAKALRVRDNGVVAFTLGEVDLEGPDEAGEEDSDEGEGDEAKDDKPAPVTRTLRVDTEFDKAKRTLQKLDVEVQKKLIELGHGERVAYLTTGHGELEQRGQNHVLDRQMEGFNERLRQLGFKVKSLGIGEGLAQEVPKDADVVIIAGPQHEFQAAEVDALRTYLRSGGSLLVAMEPRILREGPSSVGKEPGPLEVMVAEEIGVRLGEGVLAAEQGIVPITHDKLDRLHVGTNSFTSHPSSRTLAANSATSWLFTPGAGYLEEVEGHASNLTVTVRSLAFTWVDLNLNADYDADAGETKGAKNLVAAASGGEEDVQWRAVVTADASMFSDLGAGNRGNFMLIDDVVNWLIGAEALSGTTESEEDVKIEHTKEGQTSWFYFTVLGIPLLVMVLGAIRLRLHRRPVPASAEAEKGEAGR